MHNWFFGLSFSFCLAVCCFSVYVGSWIELCLSFFGLEGLSAGCLIFGLFVGA